MKILHTSDWHIGKNLHKIDLSDDLGLFFNWMVDQIKSQEIDILLVSGDIFDQANPSQASFQLYYNLLKRLLPLNIKMVVTGGNHDSAAALNAPKQILQALDIHVVGGAPKDLKDLFFRFEKEGETLVVAAVPFLKDKDIRKSVAGESYKDKLDEIKNGLKTYFQKVNEYYESNYNMDPLVIMGHMYAHGGEISDAMRDVQIGNQAGIEASIFGENPRYVALGHIHKPYKLSGPLEAHYSGSPIPLSFSERSDLKRVNILEFKGGSITVKYQSVPSFRKLKLIRGNFEQVKDSLKDYEVKEILPTLIEIDVIEEREDLDMIQKMEQFEELIEGKDIIIAKKKITIFK